MPNLSLTVPFRKWGIALFVGGLAFGAVITTPPGLGVNPVLFVALAILTSISAKTGVRLSGRRDKGTLCTWEELPIAIGVIAAPGQQALACLAIGALFTFAVLERKSTFLVVVNTSLFILKCAAAIAISEALGMNELTALVGVFGQFVLITLLFEGILFALNGNLRDLATIYESTTALALTAMAAGAMGVLGVVLWRSSPWLVIPFTALAATFLVFDRRNLRATRHFIHTGHLYAFTKGLAEARNTNSAEALAEELLQSLKAVRVDLILLDTNNDDVEQIVTVGDQHLNLSITKDLCRTKELPLKPTIVTEGAHTTFVAPLVHEEVRRGWVFVHNPEAAEGAPLGKDDLQVVTTMAQHAGIWLNNRKLVVELRAEVAMREQEASEDHLTNLPNRRSFQEISKVAATEAVEQGHLVAVMLLDLNDFKQVNDALGHGVGDQLIQAVSADLVQLTPPGSTVFRLGGDEFAILMPKVLGRHEPTELARRINERFAEPIQLLDMALSVGTSIGVAFGPTDSVESIGILQHADVAMYHSKRLRSQVEFYSPDDDTASPRRLQLQAQLKDAIRRGELFLVYQPKVRLTDAQTVGVECLVRWQSSEGLVMPNEFIPQAEQTGLIIALTDWILDQAMAQQAQWRREGLDLAMAVNVSVRNLVDTSLVGTIGRLLREHRTDPSKLIVEITETAVMSDPARARRTLEQIRDLGVEIAVDDFGIGQSSLAYLDTLPVTEVKIDQQFVKTLAIGCNEGIARTVIDLGRNLHLKVVAEGVETIEAYLALRHYGCNLAQGYFIARPMVASCFEAWIASDEFRVTLAELSLAAS